MDLSVNVLADAVVCRVSGDIDIACSPELKERLIGLLQLPHPRLIVDLSKVTFMDASGLGALLAARRRSVVLGGELRLAEPSSPVRRVLEASGLTARFLVETRPRRGRGPQPLPAGRGSARASRDLTGPASR
ncbi:STAS domain-containing protein [Sphaerisporangium sp. NPDC004334]